MVRQEVSTMVIRRERFLRVARVAAGDSVREETE